MKLKDLIVLAESAEPTDLVTIKAQVDTHLTALDKYKDELGDDMVSSLGIKGGFDMSGALQFRGAGLKKVLEKGKSIKLSKTNLAWNKAQFKALALTIDAHMDALSELEQQEMDAEKAAKK